MNHLGDITKIDGGKIEAVDCITFGSPSITVFRRWKHVMKASEKVKWKVYEAIKKKLSEMNMPQQDYERRLKAPLDRLGL